MAKSVVWVHAGICGFESTIEAWEDADGMAQIRIESNCANVQSLAGDLRSVDPMTIIVGKAKDGPVYTAAARHPLHQACPVPVAVTKAIEVAAGLALPADVVIKVARED